MDARELVALAMKRSGAKNERELAVKLSLENYEAPKRVKRWKDGENKPDYDATIKLLELAGLLRASPAARVTRLRDDAAAPVSRADLALLEEGLGRLADAVEELAQAQTNLDATVRANLSGGAAKGSAR